LWDITPYRLENCSRRGVFIFRVKVV
jgi:hypothetical protein